MDYIKKGKVLNCGHFFHSKCLKNWLFKNIFKNLKCPVCRKKIHFFELKKKKNNLKQKFLSKLQNGNCEITDIISFKKLN